MKLRSRIRTIATSAIPMLLAGALAVGVAEFHPTTNKNQNKAEVKEDKVANIAPKETDTVMMSLDALNLSKSSIVDEDLVAKEEIKKVEALPTIKEVFTEKNDEEAKPVKVQQKTVKKVVKRVVKKPAGVKPEAAEPEKTVKEQESKPKPKEVNTDNKDIPDKINEEKPPVKKVVKKVVKKQVVSPKTQAKEDTKKVTGTKSSSGPKAEEEPKEKPKGSPQGNEKFSFFA